MKAKCIGINVMVPKNGSNEKNKILSRRRRTTKSCNAFESKKKNRNNDKQTQSQKNYSADEVYVLQFRSIVAAKPKENKIGNTEREPKANEWMKIDRREKSPCNCATSCQS